MNVHRIPSMNRVAIACGTTIPTVRRWLENKNPPNTEHVHKLAQLFRVSEDYILYGEGEGSPFTGATSVGHLTSAGTIAAGGSVDTATLFRHYLRQALAGGDPPDVAFERARIAVDELVKAIPPDPDKPSRRDRSR